MQVAYVGILQDILDIDCYPCLPFKQLGLSGIAACKCLILQTVRLDWCWGDKLQYVHLGLMFSSHSRVVHVGIFNTWTHLRVIHILHSVFLKKKSLCSVTVVCKLSLQPHVTILLKWRSADFSDDVCFWSKPATTWMLLLEMLVGINSGEQNNREVSLSFKWVDKYGQRSRR